MIGGLTLMAAVPAAAKAPARPYDFNGDGRRDLAIGSPDGIAGDQQCADALTARSFRRRRN